MKTSISYSLLAAAMACSMAHGAATAYTTPVGYVSLGDTTPGELAIKASTDSAISIPLNRPTEFAGAVASTTSNTITLAGTPWTASQWIPGAATPYLVAVTSGPQNGFVGLITANTVNQLTVTPVTPGSLTGVVAGNTIKIFKAWTLITLFPAGTFGNGVRLLSYSGTVSGINLAASATYTYTTAGGWALGASPANDTILYSGESFVIRTGASTPVTSLVVSGEIPTFNSRTEINKLTVGVSQDNRVSYFTPVDEVIGSSGLSASGLAAGDRLLAFNNNAAGINKAANETITWNGTGWFNGATDVTLTYTLKAGRGYVVRRGTAQPVGVLDWNDQQAYIPSL